MTCSECQHRIAELGGAEPLPDDLAAHVDTCEDCARALVAERHVRAALVAAPWPESSLTHDIARLRALAEAADAQRTGSRRRKLMGGLAGLGALAVLGGLAARALLARDDATRVAPMRLDPALLVVLLVAGAVIWVALDVAGRRMAAAGASNASLVGLGAARAVLAAALILALLHPSTRPALEELLWPDAGHPAEAGQTVFEATLICASRTDGRLRMVAWSTGCAEDEYVVQQAGGGLPSSAALLPTVEYRAGTVVIPAGQNNVFVQFGQPMPTSDYRVVVSASGSGFGVRPFAPDAGCRMPVAGAGSREGFSIGLRRCWFEGDTVPVDPVKSDLELDWIAIESR